MNNKRIALKSPQHAKDDLSLADAEKRAEFLTAIRQGISQVERGEFVSHEQVKRDLATWLSK